MNRLCRLMIAPTLVAMLAAAGCARPDAARARLLLGATHTLQDSGLLDRLAAAFDSAQDEHALSVIVAGSGETLALARRGDLDVLLTHSPDDEAAFMASGRGELRHPVMHNEFVLLGPPSDPAGAADAADVLGALRAIQDDSLIFVSRADESGTHRRELALWAQAQRVPGWSGYVEAAAGMADALRVASQRGGYILADRATWEMLKDGLSLRLIQSDSPRLRNEYSVILVAGARNAEGGRAFVAWIRSPAARAIMSAHGITGSGAPLYSPDSGDR